MYAALLNKKLVDAVTEAKRISQNKYFCPKCRNEVLLIVSINKKPYFKHCSYAKNSGETIEHFQSKKKICEILISLGFSSEMEVSLANQQLRADILVSKELAFEIQCAPLSEAEFKHRHSLYKKIGIKDIWFVGKRHFLKNKLKETQKKYLRKSKKWGWYLLEVHLTENLIILRHHILLDPLNNKISCLSTSFSFNRNGFIALLYYESLVFKRLDINEEEQKKYLSNQFIKKTNLGQRIASELYDKGLTINQLPQNLFTTYREPLSEPNIISFLDKIKSDKNR